MTKIKYGIHESKTKWMKNHRGGGGPGGLGKTISGKYVTYGKAHKKDHSMYCLASNTFKREWTFNVIVLVIVSSRPV